MSKNNSDGVWGQRPFVVFHFYDAGEVYRRNLAHFLLFGVTANCDFLIIEQGSSLGLGVIRTNVSSIQTANIGHDFGGIVEALNRKSIPLDRASYFFINSSVRGPFLPRWAGSQWVAPFLTRLEEGAGFVGVTSYETPNTSVSEGPPSHTQSSAYALSGDAFRSLVNSGFYVLPDTIDKDHIIRDYEVGMSRLLDSQGFTADALLPQSRPSFPAVSKNTTSRDGDMNYVGGYFGQNPPLLDVMFAKTNRGIYSEIFLAKKAINMEFSGSASDFFSIPIVHEYSAFLLARARKTIARELSRRRMLDRLGSMANRYKKVVGRLGNLRTGD